MRENMKPIQGRSVNVPQLDQLSSTKKDNNNKSHFGNTYCSIEIPKEQKWTCKSSKL